jgi:hypothetical protein
VNTDEYWCSAPDLIDNYFGKLQAFRVRERSSFPGAGGPNHAMYAALHQEVAFPAETIFIDLQTFMEGSLHDDVDPLQLPVG